MTQAVTNMDTTPRRGLKSNEILVGYPHNPCATFALMHLVERTPLPTEGFVAGLVFRLSNRQNADYYLQRRAILWITPGSHTSVPLDQSPLSFLSEQFRISTG